MIDLGTIQLIDAVKEFIDKHDITCPEALERLACTRIQSDFVAQLCEIAGYKGSNDA